MRFSSVLLFVVTAVLSLALPSSIHSSPISVPAPVSSSVPTIHSSQLRSLSHLSSMTDPEYFTAFNADITIDVNNQRGNFSQNEHLWFQSSSTGRNTRADVTTSTYSVTSLSFYTNNTTPPQNHIYTIVNNRNCQSSVFNVDGASPNCKFSSPITGDYNGRPALIFSGTCLDIESCQDTYQETVYMATDYTALFAFQVICDKDIVWQIFSNFQNYVPQGSFNIPAICH